MAFVAALSQAQSLTYVSCVPNTVVGGGHDELVVHLSGNAPSGGTTVSLSSGNTGVAQVPGNVTVPQGSDVTTLLFPTFGVANSITVTITGTLNGVNQTSTVTVTPATLSDAVCSPNTIYGTKYCAFYVYLSGKAGPSGVTVNLGSSNSAVASCASSVSIGPGATYGVVTVTSHAVDSATNVTFTATLGSQEKTATLTVNPPIVTEVFSSPSSIHAGGSCHIWTYLNAPAGPSGVTVSLGNNSPSVLTEPSTVTFPAGGLYADVTATATGGVDSTTTIGLTATLGSNITDGSMTVTPAAISTVQLVPTSVIAGANSTFYVYLNGPAGPSGTSISLSSSNPAEASVPSTLTITTGGTNGKATVTTYGLNGQGGVNITGTLNGASKSAALSINVAGLASILAEPAYRIGGLSGANIYVYLSGNAGSSGTVVKLSGNNSTVATVPASVTVPANSTSAFASLTTNSVGMNVPLAVTGQVGSAPSIYTTLLIQSALGSPWPKFHGNTQNTGVGLGSGAAGTKTWSVTSGGDNACDPVIGTGNDVYFCDGGELYALNPAGTTQWTLDIGSYVYGLAVGSDGSIYVASETGLYSVSSGGTVNWNFPGANCDGAPTIGQDGNIYFGSVNGNFYSVTAAGGVNWVYSADAVFGAGYTFSSPAVGSDGTVYVGTSNSGADTFSLLALNATGTLKWSYALSHGVGSSPAIGPDGTVYVGCFDDSLYAISSTGTLKWTFATGGSIEASPAIGATGNIYVGSDDDNLYAISPAGAELWSYTAGGPVSSPSIASDGTLYVQSTDGNLYAISSTGAEKWSYYSGATTGQYPTPAIALNGTIYLGVGEFLFAIN